MSWVSVLLRVALPVVVLAVGWQALAWWIDTPYLFPPLDQVLARGAELVASGVLLDHAAASFWDLAIAIAASVVVAAPVAATARPDHVGYKTLRAVTGTLAMMPLIVVAPLVFIFLGLGDVSEVLIVFLCTLFPLLNRMLDGSFVRARPQSEHLNMPVRAMASAQPPGISLESDLSVIAASIRTALPYSFGGLFVAEAMFGSKGLGFLLVTLTNRFDVGALVAVYLIVFALSGSLYGLLALGEHAADGKG